MYCIYIKPLFTHLEQQQQDQQEEHQEQDEQNQVQNCHKF